MAVKLRLRRDGRRHYAFFHLVASDSRSPRDGRFIEQLGYYNPNTDPAEIRFNHERVLFWLQNGAQPTETVRSLLSREGILLKLHLLRKGKTAEEIEAAYQAWKAQKANKARSK
ncbi:MAG: 30S ribosomal protein S16 [Bacteroidia bacterium]|nr:30S ribosomal protein S16 [Bacteroidia bacterium]MCX7652227.1 30S ribosomal protein S16 [Bacteroidia bacterium]MDW8416489.1 30S ribosomal protein S16 [Bacteroidia bacterium]